jgi:hypothetical protein
MPKSRKRLRSKPRRSEPRTDPLALDGILDAIERDVFELDVPEVLYHYTTWEGARGIITSQQFWATAHDCTNDDAELLSADEVIIQVATELRKKAIGTVAGVLDLFLQSYPERQVTKVMTVYIACFSAARDDEEQWKKYADNGRGLCLGLRMINEAVPKDRNSGSNLMKVDYSESSWRKSVTKHFGIICSALSRAQVLPTHDNLKRGLSALNRVAAYASISAKRSQWQAEQEFRLAAILHPDSRTTQGERRSGEKTIRYLPVRVRPLWKRIAFAEIILGPNQNSATGGTRLMQLLADNGYTAGEMEFPNITVSAIPRWD